MTALPRAGAAVRARAWGTAASDGILDVCAIADGFVVAGYTFGGAGGNADILIARFDADGDLSWAKSLGGPGRDYGYGITVSDDGGIAIAGLTWRSHCLTSTSTSSRFRAITGGTAW